MDRSGVIVQVISLLGTILALVASGSFGEALMVILVLQSTLDVAVSYDRYNRSQSRRYFLRKDLLFPMDAPYWKVLNNRGSEHGYYVLLRTNKAAFDLICENVDPSFMLWRDGFEAADGRRRVGRPNMLDGRSAIAMTLAWLGSDAKSNRLLQMTFGVGHSVQDRDIYQGLAKLNEALRRIPGVVPKWPTPAEMREYSAMFENANGVNPYAPHVIFFAAGDCLRLRVDQATDEEAQREDVNRWVGHHNRNNFLASTPDGKICAASLNHPGRTHDSVAATEVTALLKNPRYTPPGAAIFSDNAFVSRYTDDVYADRYGFRPPAAAIAADPVARRLQRVQYRRLVRVSRQLSEHNNRTLEGTWRRIRHLPIDPVQSRLILETCVMLHNLNAMMVPHANQSATVYLEHNLRGL